MSYIIADRVKESSTIIGVGPVSLLGTAVGFRAFASQMSVGDTCPYVIANSTGSEWEVGVGTYSGANTLTRTTVHASTNNNNLVNFSEGLKDVFISPTAQSVIDYDPVTHQISNASWNGDVVAVSKGGTGVTTATGSGSVVLNTAPSLSGPIIDGAAPYINFANGSTTTLAAGRMWYNDNTGSWNFGMGGGNITQQVGEELFVYGKASAAITDSPLQIVYQTGTVGASGVITFGPTVANITNGDLIIGVATEPIANNGFGRITSFGIVRGITTNGTAYGEVWNDGDTIWYDPTTGNPTNVKPIAPNMKVAVGILIKAGNGGSGSIQVEINHGSVLGGTDSNVQITSPASGQVVKYNGSIWTNAAATVDLESGVTGILPVSNGGTGASSGNYFITGSSSFSPLDFSPLLWLDASDSATVYQDSGLSVLATTDGQTVAGWKDKSGNNRHLTQSLGGNTSLLKTGANGLNGLRGIKFNGSTSYFNFSSFSASGNYTAFHVFSLPIGNVFAKTISNSISNSRYTAAVNNVNLANDAYLYAMRFTGNDGYYSTSGASALQSPQCCVYQIIGNASVGFKQNRKPVWPTVTSGNANYTNTTYNIFGKDLDAAGSQISGEFIYIPSVLTAAQINLFESYLCAKWSIK